MSSTKSAIGHLLGAAGVGRGGVLHPRHARQYCAARRSISINPSVEAAVDLVPHQGESGEDGRHVALSNSFGFGGTNASLVFRKVRPMTDAADQRNRIRSLTWARLSLRRSGNGCQRSRASLRSRAATMIEGPNDTPNGSESAPTGQSRHGRGLFGQQAFVAQSEATRFEPGPAPAAATQCRRGRKPRPLIVATEQAAFCRSSASWRSLRSRCYSCRSACSGSGRPVPLPGRQGRLSSRLEPTSAGIVDELES